MKAKICFLGIFLLIGIYTVYAQKNESVWTEYRINIESNFIVSKGQYWTAGDTIINGQVYKKIVQNDHHFGDNGYIGAIREDNGKVYAILWPGDGEWENEFLLYDYTVQVGDKIISSAPGGVLSEPLTVMQIDEITLETGEKRKRFFFDNEVIWIEDIGSTSGLFQDAMWQPTNYTIPYLVCFKQEDEILYRNEELCQTNDCCADISLNDAINIPSTTSKTIITQGNNHVIIDFPEIFSGETTLRLFDATGGRIVYTDITTQGSFELNISGYPQGIYLVSIQNGNNIEYIKIIKISN